MMQLWLYDSEFIYGSQCIHIQIHRILVFVVRLIISLMNVFHLNVLLNWSSFGLELRALNPWFDII